MDGLNLGRASPPGIGWLRWGVLPHCVLVLPGFTGRGATVVKAEDAAPDGANIVFRWEATNMSRRLALGKGIQSG